jgi:hypothetical protein
MALLHVIPLFNGLITTTTGTGVNVYTVPAGDRVVVRDLTFRNVSSTTGYSLLVYVDTILVYSYSLAASESHEYKPWWVLGPGQKLWLRVGNVTGVNVIVSGSLYTI